MLRDINYAQSAHIGELVITAFEAGRDAAAEEAALLRAELDDVKRAWRDLWEKAGCPAGTPENQ